MRRACSGPQVLAPILAAALALALLVLLSLAAAAQPGAAAAAAGARPAGLRADVLAQLADAEKKLTALTQAVPAGKLTWRPAAGVRSFGEVMLHVAAANYDIASVWGVKPPAGIDMGAARGLGKGGTDQDKEKVIAGVGASFDHLRKAILALADKDLDREIDLFGQKGTVREALLGAAIHPHEHLGQAIAYARMIGIVPPWTAAQQAAPPKPGR
jgi:uncharacterized damage-inducible protein DinB